MQRRRLGRSDLEVSRLCLGTMLMGEQHSYAESEALLSAAAEGGINFFDSAEMYPVPQRAETAGRSEEILGRWLSGRAREDYVVASKVAGPSGQMTWIRGGPACLDATNIRDAIDGSLRRLGTDYIDLFQLHWPDRYVPMFGDTDYDPNVAFEAVVPFEEQLHAVGRAVEAGKVRHFGVSNETAWGLTRIMAVADRQPEAFPRAVSIQNAYNLTCRTFDASLAEVCHQEGVSLLAYSPLAMGLLTGKYLTPGGGPRGARLNRYKGRYAEAESRYGARPAVVAAVRRYCALAGDEGMSAAELAMRFVLQHPLVASAVTGATDVAQLRELLAAEAAPPLSEQTMAAIGSIHSELPNPTP